VLIQHCGNKLCLNIAIGQLILCKDRVFYGRHVADRHHPAGRNRLFQRGNHSCHCLMQTPKWRSMAEIKRFPRYSHLRSEASSYVITFRRGKQVRSGRGLAFWFRPDRTSIVEIPADDRDTDFVFQARSRDYQVVTVQGTITWRAAQPDALAARVDFTIDLRTGRLRTDPMDRLPRAPHLPRSGLPAHRRVGVRGGSCWSFSLQGSC
jgi:hypothetical protein